MEARQRLFSSSYNQKEDNNQSEINKQPKAPENQTAWNLNNQGIKEKISQKNKTGTRTDSEKPRRRGGPWGQGWLPSLAGFMGGADLRGLRGGCGLLQLRR